MLAGVAVRDGVTLPGSGWVFGLVPALPTNWENDMSATIKVGDLATFDIAEWLGDDDAIADYLSAVIDDDDPALLAAVVGDIARAKGMTEISRKTGIARETLYKALRPGAHPRFETINRVCGAFGIKLKAVPTALSR